jgi:hypothetical protein
MRSGVIGDLQYPVDLDQIMEVDPYVAAATVFPSVFASGKISYNASIFRAAVNYKF